MGRQQAIFHPRQKDGKGFRYRSHPCLRHGQVSLRSLVIRSDRQEYSTSGTERTKKKLSFIYNDIYPSYVPNIIIMYYKIFGPYLDKIKIFCCLFKTAAGIMVISMRSARVKQFLLKIVKFVFCHSKNTTKLYMSGSHNSKVTRQQINRDRNTYQPIQ